MASATIPLLSSNFYGNQILIFHQHPKPPSRHFFSLCSPEEKPRWIFNKKQEPDSHSKSQSSLPSQTALTGLLLSSLTPQALAVDDAAPSTPPPVIEAQPTKPNPSNSSPFSQNLLTAPKPQSQSTLELSEGSQWRCREFLIAVKKSKVEKVRFSKDGCPLQLTAVDGRRATIIVLIVFAATNRPDFLDSSLLRPGRFDRHLTVDWPYVAGRVKIFSGKALAKDVDFEKIARRIPGFTGANLQNLMNEAAILAARRDLKEISKDGISDALERIIAGLEKKNVVVSDEKKLVAYHEAGHALVGALMPEYDPVAKISIIPRGQAGGLNYILCSK